MAKSNLKSLNLNFITQYSNTTVDSKYSYSYYSHFYIYYTFILNTLSTSLNVLIFKDKLLNTKYSYLLVKENFYIYTNFVCYNTQKINFNFELDLNLFYINNKMFVIYKLFSFYKINFDNNVVCDYSHIISYCLIHFTETVFDNDILFN